MNELDFVADLDAIEPNMPASEILALLDEIAEFDGSDRG